MGVRRLLSHLAQFARSPIRESCYARRALPTCLRTRSAGAAFEDQIYERVGVTVESDLTWRPEVRHRDGDRPDLEAYTADGKPAAMIEAKLGAPLGEDQLRRYAADLEKRCSGVGLLLVLVPSHRDEEVTASVRKRSLLPGMVPGDCATRPTFRLR